MNSIITLKRLSEFVATDAGCTAADAEQFIKDFTAVIRDALVNGQSVDIKDVGTFSVSKGMKVEFAPDVALAEAVNSPFSMFSPEELAPGITIEELSKRTYMPTLPGLEDDGQDEQPTAAANHVESPADLKPAEPTDEPIAVTPSEHVEPPTPKVAETEPEPMSAATAPESAVGAPAPEGTTPEPSPELTEPKPAATETAPLAPEETTTPEAKTGANEVNCPIANEPQIVAERPCPIAEAETPAPAITTPAPTPQKVTMPSTQTVTRPHVATTPERQMPVAPKIEYRANGVGDDTPAQHESRRRSATTFWTIWGIVIGFLIGVAVGYFMHDTIVGWIEPSLAEATVTTEPEPQDAPTPMSVTETDTITVEEPQPQAEDTAETEPMAPAAVKSLTEVKETYDTIRMGNSLATIARKHYGNNLYWVYIYLENKDVIPNPNRISVGTRLRIPPKSKYATSDNDEENRKEAQKKVNEILSQYPQ